MGQPGESLLLFYIHQMNRMNSRNDSTINIVAVIILDTPLKATVFLYYVHPTDRPLIRPLIRWMYRPLCACVDNKNIVKF